RATPYDITEVARLVPDAFDRLAGGALLLRDPMIVSPGATLVVDSATVPTLYLRSDRQGYAYLMGNRSTMAFRGHAGHPLTITSYDPATKRPDTDRRDGRSYIDDRGGKLAFDHAIVTRLGFASAGETSGVAWMQTAGNLATGAAIDTTFSHNYFGAYSAGAEGLVITRDRFVANDVYGFDPHTATNDTVVSHSVATLNGRHGFMFSDACHGNVVKDSTAYLNGGTGFMIDDGTPEHGYGRPSSDNTLLRVTAHDNGDTGVVIEGGTGNSVQQSHMTNNDYGIWVRNNAAATRLTGNTVTASLRSGIRLNAKLGLTHLTDDAIFGARSGITAGGGGVTVLNRVRIGETTMAGLRLEGDQHLTRFNHVLITDSGRNPVNVTGAPLTAKAMAGIQWHAPAVPWIDRVSLAAFLHDTVVFLWAAILALPFISRIPLIARKIRGTSTPAT
ncbi:MAG TPA: right-handed parallel beta-helix repeat-containing protein, partial [Acidimicrobiales bacterium]